MSEFDTGVVPGVTGNTYQDADVVLGADGNFYVAYRNMLTGGLDVYQWAGGPYWGGPFNVENYQLSPNLVDIQQIEMAVTADGGLAIVMVSNVVGGAQQVAVATHGSAGWQYRVIDTIDPTQGERIEDVTLAVAADGTVHVVAARASEGMFDAKYYQFTGHGDVFEATPIGPGTAELRNVQLLLDKQGAPVLAVEQEGTGLLLAMSTQGRLTDLSSPLVMAPAQGELGAQHFPMVTWGGDGVILAVGSVWDEAVGATPVTASYVLATAQSAGGSLPFSEPGASAVVGVYYHPERETTYLLLMNEGPGPFATVTVVYTQASGEFRAGNSFSLPFGFEPSGFSFSVDDNNDAFIVSHNGREGELHYFTGLAYFAPNATGNVVIDGVLQVGETLTADVSAVADEDGLGDFQYQWRAGDTDIGGATSSSFTLTAAEVGQVISVVVTFTDSRGTLERVDGLTTAPVAGLPDLEPGPDPDPQPGTDPETPPGTPPLVDGVPVVVAPGTSPDGTPTHTVTIPVVQPGRPDSNGNSPLADIPLVTTGGKTMLEAQVPAGFGLTVSGPSGVTSGAQSLAELIREIKAHTEAGSGDQNALTGGGTSFLSGLDASSPLLVQTIVPTAVPTSGNERLVINSTATTDGGVPTALVIDASSLPAPLNLEGNGVEFFALIGHIDLLAGADTQSVWGDSGEQTVRLGTGQATVMTGGGNDTIVASFGSGAADSASARVASIADTTAAASLFHGGADEDVVRYDLASGQVVITRDFAITTVRALSDPDAVHVLINVESIAFSDKTVKVENDVSLGWIAGLYDQVLGRQAEVDGIQYWAHQHADGMSAGEIALQFLRSAEADRVLNTDTATARGITVEAFYEGLLGRASDAAGKAYWANELAKGASLADVAGAFLATAEGQGTALDQTEWNFFV
ncbi:DUF4214 domain-containing protein [Achromobacter sp. GG226]|uniref:DUF4214 domain-containing protein n=1 Tax=Verticiella alkaliphila TaxID=2779529 RepID=UPI001C0B9B5B|nr:DUF4214 domain-containing protein [Verticiella sp. GG226]MBU4611902.1 DUF4214 domain-containing protein [Verticiella sp. GG226]